MNSNEILTIHQIPGTIIEIIEETKEFCYLITPYYKPWPLLERSLNKAAQQRKKIVLIARADQDDSWEVERFNSEYGFDTIEVERLHTKLYLNEKTVLVSSMNLYESSKEYNYELGILLKGSMHSRLFFQKIIENDILSLKPNRHLAGNYSDALTRLFEHNHTNDYLKGTQPDKEESGYCIRCHATIDKSYYYVLCNECFEKWREYQNMEYQEKYCHHCGRDWSTSKAKPLCERCERKYAATKN